ncbi:MAG: hypothetical protein K8M05_16865 [Deltaproteobacteria bacterium]|nr:hypothetical protein [Kofleriaceae bacterium]
MKHALVAGAFVVGAMIACKGKAKEAERERERETERESGSGTGTGTGTGTGEDGGAGTGTAAAEPPEMPSVTLVKDVPNGPRRAADGRVVWCTRGDNGMAAWAEVQCHVVAAGKKPVVITVMSFADAMAVDEGVDPAGDADAGVKAADAQARVEAGLAKLATESGGELAAMPAPVRCAFQGGAFIGRDDDDAATATGCDVAGVTAHIDAPGKVTLTSASKSLFAEVFKARPRGKGDAGDECYLQAEGVELSVDPAAKLVVAAIELANRSDACALVTEHEVRVVPLP